MFYACCAIRVAGLPESLHEASQGSRGRWIEDERFSESADGRLRCSRLEVKQSEVRVRNRIPWRDRQSGFECGARSISLPEACQCCPEQRLQLCLIRMSAHAIACEPFGILESALEKRR